MSSVTLHVYDLSHGMARQLSPAILGKTIDGVWHTGVLVFGREYFFGGGGIQAMAPELVVQRYGMHPVRTITLGETRLTQQQFEQFLRDNNARFTDATYDLLRHNCNNFSDEVAKFLVGSGIPQYIIDLPNEALNSPFGAMLRPMLENMNNQMHGEPGDQLFSIPFNDPSRANAAVPAASAATAAPEAMVSLTSRRFKVSGSPALHLDKLVQRIKSLNAERLLSEDEISALDTLSAHVAADNKEVDAAKSVEWWKLVSKMLSQGYASSFFFPALGLFRVVMLQLTDAAETAAEKKACLETVVQATEVEPSPLSSAQKTLLLAVFVNAFANPGFSDMALSGSTRFLPFVFASIADPSTSQEARVLSAHIISNCCLAMKIGEEVVVTTIVCGAVETLDRISRLQPNAVQQQTIEGIIVGLGRLLHNFESARSLSVDLGLAEVINRLNVTPGLNAIQPLLSEVVALI